MHVAFHRTRTVLGLLGLALVGLTLPSSAAPRRGSPEELRFAVSFERALASAPLDGRLLLMLATQAEPEPRFQVTHDLKAIPVFGIDVEGLEPGAQAILDGAVFGFPISSPTTASASASTATTASSSRRPTTSTGSGSARGSRAC